MAVHDRAFMASDGNTWIATHQSGVSFVTSPGKYLPRAKKAGIQFRCVKTREQRFLPKKFNQPPNSDEFQKASEDQLVEWWEVAMPS